MGRMEKRFIQSSLIKRRRSQILERQQPELVVHKLEVGGSVTAFELITLRVFFDIGRNAGNNEQTAIRPV